MTWVPDRFLPSADEPLPRRTFAFGVDRALESDGPKSRWDSPKVQIRRFKDDMTEMVGDMREFVLKFTNQGENSLIPADKRAKIWEKIKVD